MYNYADTHCFGENFALSHSHYMSELYLLSSHNTQKILTYQRAYGLAISWIIHSLTQINAKILEYKFVIT